MKHEDTHQSRFDQWTPSEFDSNCNSVDEQLAVVGSQESKKKKRKKKKSFQPGAGSISTVLFCNIPHTHATYTTQTPQHWSYALKTSTELRFDKNTFYGRSSVSWSKNITMAFLDCKILTRKTKKLTVNHPTQTRNTWRDAHNKQLLNICAWPIGKWEIPNFQNEGVLIRNDFCRR